MLHGGFITRKAVPAFDPATLFAAAEAGAWFEADGISAGAWTDKSGRGNHLAQATSGLRGTNGSDSGKGFRLYDGVDDDWISNSWNISQLMSTTDFDCVVAFRPVAYQSNSPVAYLNSGIWMDSSELAGMTFGNLTTEHVMAYTWDTDDRHASVDVATGLDAVVHMRKTGGNVTVNVNGGSYASIAAAATAGLTGAFHLGSNGGNGKFASMRLYGILFHKVLLGASDLAGVKSHMASLCANVPSV